MKLKFLMLATFTFMLFGVKSSFAQTEDNSAGSFPQDMVTMQEETAGVNDVVDAATLEGADEFADEGLYVDDLNEDLEAETLPQDGIKFNLENWALGLRRFFTFRAEKKTEIDRQILHHLDRKLSACAEIGDQNCADRIQKLIEKRKAIAERQIEKLKNRREEIRKRFEKWREHRKAIRQKRLEILKERRGKMKELLEQRRQRRKEIIQKRREKIRERRKEIRGNIKERRQEFLQKRRDRIRTLREKRQEKLRNFRQNRRENIQERRQNRRENIQQRRQNRRENIQERRKSRRENIKEQRNQRRENIQERREARQENMRQKRESRKNQVNPLQQKIQYQNKQQINEND